MGGWIAQSVEQQTENLRVGSSILPLTTINLSLNINHFSLGSIKFRIYKTSRLFIKFK